VNTLTDHLIATAPTIDDAFRAGVDAARAGIKPRDDYATLATVRARHGFAERVAPLLTEPGANVKLDKSIVPAYGLTLHHVRSKFAATDDAPALSVNACPWAGHCTRVCVLNNGNGRYDSVQRAWRWRTEFLARHPESFARVLAWELVRAVRKHGAILFRPNVNSDVEWHRVLPSLTDGYVTGVTSYGYSKSAAVLSTDGWLGAAYRVAYSWNERSDAKAVRAFIMRGGSVAVVTSRSKGEPVLSVFPFGVTASAVDADVTDEWMFASGAVGDLSAKGKARSLIGTSKFVVVAERVSMRKRAA
jgi:hypothetical protein